MASRNPEQQNNVTSYISEHLQRGQQYKTLGSHIESLIVSRTELGKSHSTRLREQQTVLEEANRFGVHLAESVAQARGDKEFLGKLRVVQAANDERQENALIVSYFQEAGINLDDNVVPSDVTNTPWMPIISAAMEGLQGHMKRYREMYLRNEQDERAIDTLNLATACLIAIESGDTDVLELFSNNPATSEAQERREIVKPVEPMSVESSKSLIAEIVRSRPVVTPLQPAEPEVVLSVAPDAVERADSPSKSTSLRWKDLGMDAGSVEAQGYRNALNKLVEGFPEHFSASTEPLDLIETMKKLDDTTLFYIFNKSFQGPRSERSVARLLSLLAWEEGTQISSWETFEAHALEIKEGRAHDLLPKSPTELLHMVEVHEEPPTSSDAVQEAKDRFPQSEEEIEARIRKTCTEIAKRIEQLGPSEFSEKWPARLSALQKLFHLANRHVEEIVIHGLITPTYLRDNVPLFSKLQFVQLIVLDEYWGNYGASNKDVKKIMQQFEESYSKLQSSSSLT